MRVAGKGESSRSGSLLLSILGRPFRVQKPIAARAVLMNRNLEFLSRSYPRQIQFIGSIAVGLPVAEHGKAVTFIRI